MPSAFIGDGYTRTETLPATRFYEETTITFRPMPRSERDRLVMRGAQAKTDAAVVEATRQVAESLAKLLVEWDQTYPVKVEGETEPRQTMLPITGPNLLLLESNLFEKIYDTVAAFKSAKDREAEAAAEKN